MNLNVVSILCVGILAIAICVTVISFINATKEEKIKNFKEWLKWAVTEAEKALGSGTGQLKLRMVYDMAVRQFPWIVQLISFETFSEWVDEALAWMEKQIDTNNFIKTYTLG